LSLPLSDVVLSPCHTRCFPVFPTTVQNRATVSLIHCLGGSWLDNFRPANFERSGLQVPGPYVSGCRQGAPLPLPERTPAKGGGIALSACGNALRNALAESGTFSPKAERSRPCAGMRGRKAPTCAASQGTGG